MLKLLGELWISNERITPKKLRIGKEIKKDEVVALLALVIIMAKGIVMMRTRL